MSKNKRLKEAQKALGFKSQKDFAERLNIKQGSLSDIYREKVGVGVSNSIKRILELEYSINIDWLLTGKGSMLKNNAVPADLTNHPPESDTKDQIGTLMKVVETLSENERTNSKNVAELIAQGRQQTDNITRLIDLLCQKGVNIERLIDKEKGGLKTSGRSGDNSASDVGRANVG